MSDKKFLTMTCLLSSVLVLLACSLFSMSNPTTGTISGMVFDKDGKPLENIDDRETLIVALYCSGEETDVECLREDFWDIGLKDLFDFICEANDGSDNCLLHLGQGAASVQADGSYTLTNVPPGQYGLVFMFNGLGLSQTSLMRDVATVRAGETTKCDVETKLYRK